MKIDGITKRIATLERQKIDAGEAVVQVNNAVTEARTKLNNSEKDAHDPVNRRTEPAYGGLVERVENFDRAFERIRGARSEELREVTNAASKVSSVQSQLTQLLSTLEALSPKPARDLNLLEAAKDHRAAVAVVWGIDNLKKALKAAPESKFANNFPVKQLDAIETAVKAGMAQLAEKNPGVATGNFKPADVVDGGGQRLLTRIEELQTAARSGKYGELVNRALSRVAWITTSEREGPRFDAAVKQWQPYVPQALGTSEVLRRAAVAERPLTIGETAAALLANNGTAGSMQFALVTEVCREMGGAALVREATTLNVKLDIASPQAAQMVFNLAHGEDQKPVLTALHDAVSKNPSGRLTGDETMAVIRDLSLSPRGQQMIASYVASDPITFHGLLPDNLREPFSAVAKLYGLTTLSTPVDVGVQQARQVFDARAEELFATVKRHRAEKNLDVPAMRTAAAENLASNEQALASIQSKALEAIPAVTGEAAGLRATLGEVIGKAKDAVTKVVKKQPNLASLQTTLTSIEARLRGHVDQLERNGLAALTNTINTIPPQRSAAEQTNARFLASLIA